MVITTRFMRIFGVFLTFLLASTGSDTLALPIVDGPDSYVSLVERINAAERAIATHNGRKPIITPTQASLPTAEKIRTHYDQLQKLYTDYRALLADTIGFVKQDTQEIEAGTQPTSYKLIFFAQPGANLTEESLRKRIEQIDTIIQQNSVDIQKGDAQYQLEQEIQRRERSARHTREDEERQRRQQEQAAARERDKEEAEPAAKQYSTMVNQINDAVKRYQQISPYVTDRAQLEEKNKIGQEVTNLYEKLIAYAKTIVTSFPDVPNKSTRLATTGITTLGTVPTIDALSRSLALHKQSLSGVIAELDHLQEAAAANRARALLSRTTDIETINEELVKIAKLPAALPQDRVKIDGKYTEIVTELRTLGQRISNYQSTTGDTTLPTSLPKITFQARNYLPNPTSILQVISQIQAEVARLKTSAAAGAEEEPLREAPATLIAHYNTLIGTTDGRSGLNQQFLKNSQNPKPAGGVKEIGLENPGNDELFWKKLRDKIDIQAKIIEQLKQLDSMLKSNIATYPTLPTTINKICPSFAAPSSANLSWLCKQEFELAREKVESLLAGFEKSKQELEEELDRRNTLDAKTAADLRAQWLIDPNALSFASATDEVSATKIYRRLQAKTHPDKESLNGPAIREVSKEIAQLLQSNYDRRKAELKREKGLGTQRKIQEYRDQLLQAVPALKYYNPALALLMAFFAPVTGADEIPPIPDDITLTEIVQYAIENGADPNYVYTGRPLISWAIAKTIAKQDPEQYQNYSDALGVLINNHHTNLSQPATQAAVQNLTPLMIAITAPDPSGGYAHNVNIARTLLAADQDVNINYQLPAPVERIPAGSTALMLATERCQTEVVRKLLAKGADRYLRNANGHTAQQIAEIVATQSTGSERAQSCQATLAEFTR